MPCGCQNACGCDFVAGAGIEITTIGDTVVISSTTSAGIVSVSADPCIPLSVTAGVLGATLIVDPANVEIALSCGLDGLAAALVIDNASGNGGVNLAVSGTGVYADLIIDPASTAPVSVGPAGLLVDCCGGDATTVLDTNSIDMTLLGAQISSDLRFQDTNSIDLGVDASGLKGDLRFIDTNSIDLSVGLSGLLADLKLDPASPLTLSITAAGLSVSFSGPGGWVTQVKLANQTFSAVAVADITDLTGFAPVALRVYEFEAKLIVGSSVATVAPIGQCVFPAGLTQIAHVIRTAENSYTTEKFIYGGPSSPISNTNAPAINIGYLMELRGIVDVGAAPGVGNIKMQFASEVGGTNVFVYKGSMLRWRKIA